MNNSAFNTRFLPVMALLLLPPAAGRATPALPNINTNNIVNITSFGAVSSTTLTNTTAIQNAINAAAAGPMSSGAAGGTVEIPPGVYLSGPLTLASSVNIQIDAGAILRMLPLAMYPGGTNTGTTFISGSNLHDIELSGSGAIDGQGAAWWPFPNANRAVMFSPANCNRILIQNVTLSNSPMFHIAISGSHSGNVTVQGVTIRAPSSSPNTDACDVSGTNILVQNCNISEGDDDFTCGGGTSDVLLTNNTYGTGHGISIGSYTDGGVSNITVINCTISGAVNGIRIKSDNDRGGLVQNISYSNIGMTNVNIPIQIYGYYNEVGTPSSITPATAASQPIATVSNTTPIFRNITFSNINATSLVGNPVGIIWARKEMPATNIVFNRVNLTGNKNFCLYNVSGAQFIDSKINVTATSNSFALYNAQVVVSNSVPTNTLFKFAGLTASGYNNSFAFYNAQASLKDTNTFDHGPLTLSASTFSISNSLILSPAAVLNYVLGTNVDKLVVVGSLALGGTINLTNGPGFTNGTYTLMNYTPNLSGSLPTIGSALAGYAYAFDTNTAGQVKLVATYTGVFPFTTTTTVQSSENPSIFGTAVTFTATVSPAPTNGETITFKDGGTTLGTGTLSGGQAVFTTAAAQLATGSHSITAVYAGAGGYGTTAYAASTSSVLLQVVNPSTGVFFNDTFSSSTVNSATPTAPTLTSTSYEIMSSKGWNPTPSIAPKRLVFGIAATSSGVIEAQAQFASQPIALLSAGDFVQLSVTFTNTAGILTQSGFWGFGLYNSGGVAPMANGMNGTLSTNSTVGSGGAQNWRGYVAQIGFTGGNSSFFDRKSQVGNTNNSQDLVTSGTTASYRDPAATAVGSASTTPSVTLTVGSQYTEILTYTLMASGAIQLQSQLYTGTNNAGTLLSTMTSTTGTTPLTNSFDSLAVGWRATGSTVSTMTISSILVSGQSTTVVTLPTTTTVQSSINPCSYGTALTLTASVNPAPTNGETVAFLDGSTALGTGALSGGQATFNTTATQFAASPHPITVIYAGDGAFGSSTSSVLSQVVDPLGLTVSGLTVNDKAYDGTTAATINTNGWALNTVIGGDDVTLVTNGSTATFDSADVANGITVTVDGLSLGGTQASNYSLVLPITLAANITNQVVANNPPVANPATYYRLVGYPLTIVITNLATNWSDVDNDTLVLTNVDSYSTNGGTVTYDSTNIYYTDSNSVTDQFGYTISDGQGGTALGFVTVLMAQQTVSGGIINGDGSVTLNFSGIPGTTYWVEATTNLAPPVAWTILSTNTADTNGLWQFTDLQATNNLQGFYRTRLSP